MELLLGHWGSLGSVQMSGLGPGVIVLRYSCLLTLGHSLEVVS